MPGVCVPLEAARAEVACPEYPGCDGDRHHEDLRRWKFLAPVHPYESAETMLRLGAIAEALSGELVTLSVVDSTAARNENGPRDLMLRDVILHGDPASRIRRYSSFVRPDFLLMPSHPARFPVRFWQKSVLSEILLRTDHAVMVVPGSFECDTCQRIRNVLCVVHLDGTDAPLLHRTATIASRLNAETTLLHVLPEVHEGSLVSGLEEFDTPLSLCVATERMAKLRVPGRPHRVEIRTGSVKRNVAAIARGLRADLIVTQRYFRRSHCPAINSLQRDVACPILSLAWP
jgi:hypothetical protein